MGFAPETTYKASLARSLQSLELAENEKKRFYVFLCGLCAL